MSLLGATVLPMDELVCWFSDALDADDCGGPLLPASVLDDDGKEWEVHLCEKHLGQLMSKGLAVPST